MASLGVPMTMRTESLIFPTAQKRRKTPMPGDLQTNAGRAIQNFNMTTNKTEFAAPIAPAAAASDPFEDLPAATINFSTLEVNTNLSTNHFDRRNTSLPNRSWRTMLNSASIRPDSSMVLTLSPVVDNGRILFVGDASQRTRHGALHGSVVRRPTLRIAVNGSLSPDVALSQRLQRRNTASPHDANGSAPSKGASGQALPQFDLLSIQSGDTANVDEKKSVKVIAVDVANRNANVDRCMVTACTNGGYDGRFCRIHYQRLSRIEQLQQFKRMYD